MRIIDASKTAILDLGYSGEKDRTRVKFYYGDVAEEFPGGIVILQVKRPGENTKHDIQLATDEFYNAWWTVGDYECERKGVGECQLIYLQDSKIAKKKIWRTSVDHSLEGVDASIPDTWQSIETRLLEAASDVLGTIHEFEQLESNAAEYAHQAEEIAYGTRDGVPVESDNPHSTENALAYTQEIRTTKQEIEDLIGEHGTLSLDGIYFVEGTHASQSSDWTGDLLKVSALKQGMTIAYRLPYRGIGFEVTLTLTLKDGVQTAMIPVYYSGNIRMTTQYEAGSIIILTYYNNSWRGSDYSYDSNTHLTMAAQRLMESGTDMMLIYVQTDGNFMPASAGYNLIRFPLEWTYPNYSGDDKYFYLYFNGDRIPLTIDGSDVLENGDTFHIGSGSYLIYFNGHDFLLNTDGTIPGQPSADQVRAGLMSPADKEKLDNLDITLFDLDVVQYSDTDNCIYFMVHTQGNYVPPLDANASGGKSHNFLRIHSYQAIAHDPDLTNAAFMLKVGEEAYPINVNGSDSYSGGFFQIGRGQYIIYWDQSKFVLKTNGYEATATSQGFMSAADKVKLDNLEARVADLEYVPIQISSMSVTPSLAEVGSTVTSATLTYAMNRDATQMKLDGNEIENTNQNGTISQTGLTLTANKTWTLQATDERKSVEDEWVSKTATLTFTNKIKYGTAAEPETVDDTFLNGLGTKTLSTGIIRSFTVNAEPGQYIWYALPLSYGMCSFTVGGFTGGFSMVKQLVHTNESGTSVAYRVYRSDNAGLGIQTVSVA